MNNLTLKCPIGHFKGKGRKKQKTKRKLFMDYQSLLKNPQTNWKYILIIAILAFLVGGGILGYQYWWLPRQEVEMPEIEIPEKIIEDETANWKTYRNEEDGFEVRYPGNWELIGGNLVPIKNEEGAGMQIRREPTDYSSLKDYLASWEYSDPGRKATWNVHDEEFVIIDGEEFYKYRYIHQVAGESYVGIRNGDLVYIGFWTAGCYTGMENCDPYLIFIQILSTFRFLE